MCLEQDMSNEDRTSAFIKLFTSHEARLSAFAMSLIPNWADADDVLQQTNLILWKKFDEFELGTNFFAWAGRILYLEAKEFRKKKLRSKLHFNDDLLDAVAATAVEMSDTLANQQKVLGDCIAKLNHSQREILRLRYEERGSVATVATEVNRSIKTIYNSLGAIRKLLIDCVTRRLAREGSYGV
jgi:RNA polymerase sigma-70 factor (ECF subfamily)